MHCGIHKGHVGAGHFSSKMKAVLGGWKNFYDSLLTVSVVFIFGQWVYFFAIFAVQRFRPKSKKIMLYGPCIDNRNTCILMRKM